MQGQPEHRENQKPPIGIAKQNKNLVRNSQSILKLQMLNSSESVNRFSLLSQKSKQSVKENQNDQFSFREINLMKGKKTLERLSSIEISTKNQKIQTTKNNSFRKSEMKIIENLESQSQEKNTFRNLSKSNAKKNNYQSNQKQRFRLSEISNENQAQTAKKQKNRFSIIENQFQTATEKKLNQEFTESRTLTNFMQSSEKQNIKQNYIINNRYETNQGQETKIQKKKFFEKRDQLVQLLEKQKSKFQQEERSNIFNQKDQTSNFNFKLPPKNNLQKLPQIETQSLNLLSKEQLKQKENNQIQQKFNNQQNDEKIQVSNWLSKNLVFQKKIFLQAKEGNIKDQYYFEKKIGQGGFGVVYKAKNRLTKKNVAIKAVKKNQISDMNSFMREYQMLSQLDHPNIINIREIWKWQDMFFIVTDFCDGGDLFAHMLDRQQLQEPEFCQIMKQLLMALNYMHSQKIIHRDIKLENIMLQNEGDSSIVKLIDFGLSRNIVCSEDVRSLCSGTPFYIAPELINLKVTTSSDIWALGVVMYVCLSGKLPFPGNSTDEIFSNVLYKDLMIFQDPKLDHLSKEAKDLLNQILKKVPNERITAKQALQHPFFQVNISKLDLIDVSPNLTKHKYENILGKLGNYDKNNQQDQLEYKKHLKNTILEFDKWSNELNPVMRKLCYLQLANNIDEKDVKILPEIFIKMDQNKDGQVCSTDLKEFIRSIDLQVDSEKIKKIFDKIDQSKNDQIDYREFVAAQAGRYLFKSKKQQEINFNLIVQSFNFFDQNDDGDITREDLQKILRTDNPDVSDEMIDQLIEQVDTDNDGKINFEEFVIMLRLHENLKDSSRNSHNDGNVIPDSIMSQSFKSTPDS